MLDVECSMFMSRPEIGCHYRRDKRMMKPTIRYSLAFKKKVLSELASGRFSNRAQAAAFYGINGCGTISYWVKTMGREDLERKIVRVEVGNEPSKIKELEKRIKELERVVADQAVKSLFERSMLEVIAEENSCTVEELRKKKDIKL